MDFPSTEHFRHSKGGEDMVLYLTLFLFPFAAARTDDDNRADDASRRVLGRA